MQTALSRSSQLKSLCDSVQAAQMSAAHMLLSDVANSVSDASNMLADLPEALREGTESSYARHVAYADPHGGFTIAYLIWRPGQASPVHGHKTWCTYRVLQGELQESHYRWDVDAGVARLGATVVRRPGEIVTASPGLRQIHRLGNAGGGVAISLHVYGVAVAELATGVNCVVDVGG